MSTTQWPSRVVPAQLSFLAIYNPSLGITDETFRDQLVFYYSRAAHEARVTARKSGRNDAAGGDALRAEENEKLRQIGLAQGMVDFARSFSNGEPVDSIETEKSRIVLRELEKGWWIVASVDLTRLPSISQTSVEPTKRALDKGEAKSGVEYSSREVSPPALLVQQLLQAHYIFGLHHGPSLNDLFIRLSRDKFCTTLDRFWTRFAGSWDVLLHGNPAADVFSGIKLASGGELGFGVGEEEWGSGEREVLEDLTRRTEGLVDLVVSRFGEPALLDKRSAISDEEALPWMGGGSQPIASDGVIFGGVGSLKQHSLRDVSLWMRQIYTYGEYAYGVKDNPLRERRKRRRRNPPEQEMTGDGDTENSNSLSRAVDPPDQQQDVKQKLAAQKADNRFTPDPLRQTYSRTVSHDSTASPEETVTSVIDTNIPPPVVSAGGEALPKATDGVQPESEPGSQASADVGTTDTTLGIPDQYMKYLTFGLSTLAKPKRPSTLRQSSGVSGTSQQPASKDDSVKPKKPSKAAQNFQDVENAPMMKNVDPIPDGETLRSKIAVQKQQENRGHFVIGLKGDLLELDEISEDDQTELSDGDLENDASGSRIVLRTVQVEVTPGRNGNEATEDHLTAVQSNESEFDPADGEMSHYRRCRVVVYVHRPFIYCFLFEDRTYSLQYTKFYRSLHRNLVPIHKPLLSSTSVTKVTQRIENSHTTISEEGGAHDPATHKLPNKSGNDSPIYDLIYDPARLKLHTSIPNIPQPGTPAAEGIFTSLLSDATPDPPWTRIEALNVHSQILNTLHSVKNRRNEVERTSKTSRGWWVVWMKIPAFPSHQAAEQKDTESKPEAESSVQTVHSDATKKHEASTKHETGMDRVAFLVRKAADAPAPPKSSTTSSRAVTSMLEVMSLGMASRDDESTGGASAGWGPAALAGGIGIDAKRYVEGLLSLNR